MGSKRTIRQKLLIAITVLGTVILVLGYTGFRGAYAYRDLAVILSQRAAEFPVADALTRAIDDLRISYLQTAAHGVDLPSLGQVVEGTQWSRRTQHRAKLQEVREALASYKARLEVHVGNEARLGDRSLERQMVQEIETLVHVVLDRSTEEDLFRDRVDFSQQLEDLDRLSDRAHQLPTFLHHRMASFRDEVRTRYRTWIALAWSSTFFTLLLLVGLCVYVRRAVILPFKALLQGSRRVAGGDYEHRIIIDSQDELSELAQTINRGTERFLKTERELHHQVQERSREVIRNEQLASVGFLAAGVAHEINNPLASIAWSAEALESRLHRILHPLTNEAPTEPPSPDVETLRSYLRRIQDDAFRCKGITERLLDFSRLGNAEKKHRTDLASLVRDVVDMVQHLGQYRERRIEFQQKEPIWVWASPPEIKQVVLNLLTNALDALPESKEEGWVRILLESSRTHATLVITDNGCGMTDEVKQHLFEPFFTRRRDGRGTGLGLPITSRIIADHGGRITPHSDGVGQGSRFEVTLPVEEFEGTHERSYQAA